MHNGMKLTKEDYEKFQEYLLSINEENIDGAFFVKNEEDLKKQVFEYVMNEDNNLSLRETIQWEIENLLEEGNNKGEVVEKVIETFIDDLRWTGEGMYHLWGIHFTSDVTVANTVEIFEAETGGFDHQAYLGNRDALEQVGTKILGANSYVYLIYSVDTNNFEGPLSFKGIVDSNAPLNEIEAIAKYLGLSESDALRDKIFHNYSSIEVRDLDIDLLVKYYRERSRY